MTRGTTPGGPLYFGEILEAIGAARRAREVWPGPVGELVARELRGYVDGGRRALPTALVPRMVEEILRPGI